MPTTPFSSDLVTDLTGPTAWKFETRVGAVFHPRFFCCDSIYTGLTPGKEPVAIMSLVPHPLAFVGDNVLYTGTASYDPDGSITAYAWTFEGHSPSSGTTSAGTLNWGTAGTYTVELTVTDGTSLQSSPARLEIVVVDRWNIGGEWLATSNGIYYSTNATTWTAQNTGLSGTALQVNKVIIDPATRDMADSQKALWAATNAGMYFNIGTAGTWVAKQPGTVENDWSDSPAPTVAELKFVDAIFADDRLIVAANWQNGSSEWRSWLFYTDDAGAVRSGTAGTVTWTEI